MTVHLQQAKIQLSRLAEHAAAGEEIIIATAGHQIARLGALAPARPARMGQRQLGGYAHLITVADDFDDPVPEDVQRAFDGEMP